MSRRNRFALGALFALAVTYGITACGGDDDASVVVVLDDPTLAITALQPVGGPRWEPGSGTCVEVGRDPKQTIALLAATNYRLRPAGTCGSFSQCGTVRVRLDPSGDTEALRVESSSATVEIPFDTIALGSHTFRLELIDKNGNNVIDKVDDSSTYKLPLVTEVTLDVTAAGDCGGTVADGGDASTDADIDASTDGGEDASDAGSDATEAGDDADTGASDAQSDASEGGSNDASADGPKDAPTG
jgi:hypothetical protein